MNRLAQCERRDHEGSGECQYNISEGIMGKKCKEEV